MILGQSIFDAVMERLKDEWESGNEASGQPGGAGGWGSVRGFKSSYVPSTAFREDDDTATLDRFYFAFPAEEPENEEKTDGNSQEFDGSRFDRLSPEEIAFDLGISETDTAAILLNRRRKFAQANHPDKAPPEWRDKANLRMKIANLLVDEAIKRVKPLP